jgi:hypothetical protein
MRIDDLARTEPAGGDRRSTPAGGPAALPSGATNPRGRGMTASAGKRARLLDGARRWKPACTARSDGGRWHVESVCLPVSLALIALPISGVLTAGSTVRICGRMALRVQHPRLAGRCAMHARRCTLDARGFAGVDGCRPAGSWHLRRAASATSVRIVPRFADVLGRAEAPSVVAVDIPIGLPERAGPGGRAPRMRAAPSGRATVLGVFGPFAGRARAADYRRGLPDRVRQFAAAAQGIEAAVHGWPPENPRGRRVASATMRLWPRGCSRVHPEGSRSGGSTGERGVGTSPKKGQGRCTNGGAPRLVLRRRPPRWCRWHSPRSW